MGVWRLVVATGVSLAAALGVTPTGQATGRGDLTVMTQNLYLGSSLAPALTATDAAGFLHGVATIYQTVLFTDFARAPCGSHRRQDSRSPSLT